MWTRGYLRGRFSRHRGVKTFAALSLGLYLATFAVGNVIYPVYKVNVRAQYLDDPSALVEDYVSRQKARQRVLDHPTPSRPTDEVALAMRMASVSRWFDVKEHWMSLGLALSFACAAIVYRWNPSKNSPHSRVIAPIVFALAVGQAATTWFGAIVGIVVSSYRSIGNLG